jgi:predicted AlkP superfamily phosphohydrolase/phosphomutase
MAVRNLLIGFDALDPTVLARMTEKGELPAFRRLHAASRAVAIENYRGMGAGAFWPSAATGWSPDFHGRYYGVRFDPSSYDFVRFEETTDFACEPVWRTLDRQGKKVGVIDWPVSPVEELKNGFVVDNWLSHDSVKPARSMPRHLARDLVRRHGIDPWKGGLNAHRFETAEEVRHFMEVAAWRIRIKTDFVLETMGAGDWDLLAPVYSEMHDIGHYCFHISNPDHPLHDPAVARELEDPIEQAMRLLDSALAELVEAAGSRARVMALAGPGMDLLATANGALDEIAWRLDKGPAPADAGRAGHDLVRGGQRLIPRSARRLVAPFLRPLKRHAISAAYRNRRFFAVPHNANAGCIRFNIRGRERYGMLEPSEREPLTRQLRERLLELRCAETGEPVVEDVLDGRDMFLGPRSEAMPDIFVVWRRHRPFGRIASPSIGEVAVPRGARTGDHTPHGFFWGGDSVPLGNGNSGIKPHEASAAILGAVRADSEVEAVG